MSYDPFNCIVCRSEVPGSLGRWVATPKLTWAAAVLVCRRHSCRDIAAKLEWSRPAPGLRGARWRRRVTTGRAFRSYIAFLLLVPVLAACAPGNTTTCTVTWVARVAPPASNRCPVGAVVTGIRDDGSQLCSDLIVTCPNPAK